MLKNSITEEAMPLSTSPANQLQLEIALRSLLSPTGRGRKENQDNFLFIDGQGCARFLLDERETQRQIANWPPGHQRIAVLDGMGGHSAGRQASEQAVIGLLDIPAMTELATLSAALNALHQRLYQQFQQAGLETGCTLILLEIPPAGPGLLFHVGDSRLYVIDAQHAKCLTVDHVPATHLALLGLLSESEWEQHVHVQNNSQISQAFILGSTMGAKSFHVDSIDEDIYELDDSNLPEFLHGLSDRRILSLEPDRVYLLASDGLWHLHYPQLFIRRWSQLLMQPQQSLEMQLDRLLEELAATIRQQRSQPDDNTTVILLRYVSSATEHIGESG